MGKTWQNFQVYIPPYLGCGGILYEQQELNRKKYEQKKDDKNRDLLNSLHSKEIIDAEGNIMT